MKSFLSILVCCLFFSSSAYSSEVKSSSANTGLTVPTIKFVYENCKTAARLAETGKEKEFMQTYCAARWTGFTEGIVTAGYLRPRFKGDGYESEKHLSTKYKKCLSDEARWRTQYPQFEIKKGKAMYYRSLFYSLDFIRHLEEREKKLLAEKGAEAQQSFLNSSSELAFTSYITASPYCKND